LASQCVQGAQVIERRNSVPASLLSKATASNICREKYRAFGTISGQHPIPQGSRKTGYSSSSLFGVRK